MRKNTTEPWAAQVLRVRQFKLHQGTSKFMGAMGSELLAKQMAGKPSPGQSCQVCRAIRFCCHQAGTGSAFEWRAASNSAAGPGRKVATT